MSTTKDDGGPAFPHHDTDEHGQPYRDHGGMSLRDYFAGKAVQGMLADPDCETRNDRLATFAYDIADAMIAERNK